MDEFQLVLGNLKILCDLHGEQVYRLQNKFLFLLKNKLFTDFGNILIGSSLVTKIFYVGHLIRIYVQIPLFIGGTKTQNHADNMTIVASSNLLHHLDVFHLILVAYDIQKFQL